MLQLGDPFESPSPYLCGARARVRMWGGDERRDDEGGVGSGGGRTR